MKRFSSALVVLLPLFLFAQQGTFTGTVTADNGDALVGVNVFVEGTTLGAATDANGGYTIANVPAGTYTLTASMIGYESVSQSAEIQPGLTNQLDFVLVQSTLEMSALEVLASRADVRTPVAYTNVAKEEMEIRLGSQDIPMILNLTPSVYATQQGGGAGDARINVRGFNQRNIAVMINGVPQNDMENGWVYWSNWDGVGDATSSIQMQRGLSAVNLATPSIGGTMNIITDPASFERGGKFKQEIGDGGFRKTTINLNTGLIADKFALSGSIVRKTGDGIIDGNWTDAWAYYLGASLQLGKANRFEVYAIGAPQRHGQNLYRQNIATYSQEFAETVEGYNTEAFADGNQFSYEAGRYFSQNWAPVSSDYKGKQYWYMYGEGGMFGGGLVDRYSPDFLNERENYFHKPLVNMNHYLTLSDNMRLSSVFYWSGGSGGGTGTYGSSFRQPAVAGNRWYASSPWTWAWDDAIATNSDRPDLDFGTADENRSKGILRNSINRQNTYGLISKLNFKLNESLELQAGIDWRTAGIEHAREVRDLLGGDYYVDFADKNAPNGKRVELGDIIAYHNSTTVDWFGYFLQGNYSTEKFNIYGMFGSSSIAYTYQDHFTVANEVIEADAISTVQYKGGGLYNLDDKSSVFINAGYVQKPPIMDNVIYFDGTVASDPSNEKFKSYELGYNYNSSNLAFKASYYQTDWIDRNLTKSVTTGQGSSGDTDVIFLTGVNQKHRGIEFESKFKPHDMIELDFVASLGKWQFDGDASGRYQYDIKDSNDQVIGQGSLDYDYALDTLYVGDMPQTSYVFGLTLKPAKGFRVQAVMSYYDKNYADWSPDAREISGGGEADRSQVWMAPAYSKTDLHVSYQLPSFGGLDLALTGHVFNLFDDVYVQDATDNSQYNGYGAKEHLAHNAEVFLGTPRYANIGLSVKF